jgi:hypothetical protein
VARVSNDLYERSVCGRGSDWFRGVQLRHEGRIEAGGIEKDAIFVEESDPAVIPQIDAAYRTKCCRSTESIISTTVTPQARSATIKLVPRSTSN